MESLLALLAASFLFVGCATGEKYSQNCASYVGKSVEDVIGRFGPPSQVTDISPTRKMYHFVKNGPTTVDVEKNQFTGPSATVSRRSCTTSFTVENNIVEKWAWNGYCTAY